MVDCGSIKLEIWDNDYEWMVIRQVVEISALHQLKSAMSFAK